MLKKLFAKKSKTKGYPRGYTPTSADLAVDNFVANTLKQKQELNYTQSDYEKLVGKKLQIFNCTNGEDITYKLESVAHLENSTFGDTFYLLANAPDKTQIVFHPRYQDESFCFITAVNGKTLDGYLSLSDHEICAELLPKITKS
ncbi:MAG: hypothetical protein FWE01_00555 [Firmicutes bacterium]|nr:hypothetical protein [Bacillota bacterium]